jgi:drug/metabolite transporter (DMT)-like permease
MSNSLRRADLVRLLLLAAIWGGSFLFMRVLAPAIGPLWTASSRVLIAGLVLLAWFRWSGFVVPWRGNLRHYAIIGGVGSALPFSLFAFAALHLPAGLSAILNASAPLFGAVLGALFLGESLTPTKLTGLALGVLGVGLVSGVGGATLDAATTASILACLGAARCYSLAGVYLKKFAGHLAPRAIAAASQLCAGLMILPLTPLGPAPGALTPVVIGAALGLSLLCSALAYLLYYRLIADLGPTRALTVTFLIPAFGMLWGALLLGEAITATMLLGTASIIAGTLLTTRAAATQVASSARAARS